MVLDFSSGSLLIKADAVCTTALAAIMLLIGYWIKDKSTALRRYCIPAPVVGGFLFMFITFIGHQTEAFAFKFDTYYQNPFMLAFFTTVGLGASLSLLKKGGTLLIIYWLTAGAISICQNAIGIGISMATGLEAPYALLASAISMIGGHGAAGAYGKTFVSMGYPAGLEVGMAAATFGLISAVLVGGPLARVLIERHHLTPDMSEDFKDTGVENVNAATGEKLDGLTIIKNVTAILVCMAIGTVISGRIGALIGMSFPTYVGAMFVAVILRNVNESGSFLSVQLLPGGFHWRRHAEPISCHCPHDPPSLGTFGTFRRRHPRRCGPGPFHGPCKLFHCLPDPREQLRCGRHVCRPMRAWPWCHSISHRQYDGSQGKVWHEPQGLHDRAYCGRLSRRYHLSAPDDCLHQVFRPCPEIEHG